MKNLTPELIVKAKAAKSAEELLDLAKENNVELTEEEAKIYFEQLNANDTISDDEVDMVSGGGGCPGDDDSDKSNTMPCRHCSRPVPVLHTICPYCGKLLVYIS